MRCCPRPRPNARSPVAFAIRCSQTRRRSVRLQEVIYGPTPFAQLGRVAACEGPDAITLENEKATFHLEDLIPVVRAQERELLSRSVVYAMQHVGWFQTTLVRIDGRGAAIVKHHDQAFKGDFFNQSVEQNLLRLPLRQKDRRRPARLAMLKDQFLDNPAVFIVKAGFGVIFLGLGGSFLIAILYALITTLLGH